MKKWLKSALAAMMALFMAVSVQPVKAEDTSDIKIQYEGSIHYVEEDGTKIILYCLQNKRYWPHDTDSFKAPGYEKTTFDAFCKENKVSDEQAIAALSNRLKRVLYAGYDYNGLGLYGTDGSSPELTAEEFNELLHLDSDDPLRTDFPDSIGTADFTYDANDYPNQVEKDQLEKFVGEVVGLKGLTASGRTASDIECLPFYFAAFSYAYAQGGE